MDGSRVRPLQVALVVRADSAEKGGGDLIQAQRYQSELQCLGLTIEILTPSEVKHRQDFDIVHLFNVDLPFEFIEAASVIGDTPVVVSAIHRDSRFVRRMFRANQTPGIEQIANRMPLVLREYLAACRRVLSGPGTCDFKALRILHYTCWLPSVRATIRHTLVRADRVLVLSSKERRSLQRDAGIDLSNTYLLPNGLESSSVHSKPRTSKCLVIGRIEPGKRQLEVLDCAEQMGLALTFIGSLNENHTAYAKAFVAKVRASKQSKWLGALTHDEVMAQLSTALCVVNLSWIEVQSLVELEGVASGCWVVAGSSGGNAEFFSDRVFEFDPERTEEALDTVRRLVRDFESNGRTAEGFDQNSYPSWEDIGQRLLSLYEEAFDLQRQRGSDSDSHSGSGLRARQ